jgi:hypothetical protein
MEEKDWHFYSMKFSNLSNSAKLVQLAIGMEKKSNNRYMMYCQRSILQRYLP